MSINPLKNYFKLISQVSRRSKVGSIAFSLFLLMGCSGQENTPSSVLVIAFESLSSVDINCNNDSIEHSGFQALCRESIRFTHAYAPSTLSVPTIASIVTGQYPFQHGVRHNKDFLKSEIETIPELIKKQKIDTAFFSGGAPILRRNNLHQGFDYVEDSITPGKNFPYHDLEKNLEAFKTWVENKRKYFAMIYVPDLLYEEETTVNKLGESRNRSIESRLEDVNESLHDFFQDLKKSNRWDSTTIVLLGLNGRTRQIERSEIGPINIHSENTQVPLLIKLGGQKKRDEPLIWTIDQPTSLADIGPTLADFFGAPKPAPANNILPITSLAPSIQNNSYGKEPKRWIAVESGWPLQFGDSGFRFSIRDDTYLIKNSSPISVFNTLVDRFETSFLNSKEGSELYADFHTATKLAHAPTEYEPDPVLVSKFLYYLKIRPWNSLLKLDQELKEFILVQTLTDNDFTSLKNLAKESEFKSFKPWFNYVLSKKIVGEKQDPCIAKKYKQNDRYKCDESLYLEFLEAKNEKMNSKALKRFLADYAALEQERKAYFLNWKKGLIWAGNDRIKKPLRSIDWELALPENQKLKIANQ